jgi:hypothetical protein
VASEKALDPRQCRHERACKLCKGNSSDDHQQTDAIAHNRLKLVWFVTYSPIVRDRDPTFLPYLAKPLLVCRVRREMVVMALDSEPGRREYFGESFP